jgi:hypothetical protein
LIIDAIISLHYFDIDYADYFHYYAIIFRYAWRRAHVER